MGITREERMEIETMEAILDQFWVNKQNKCEHDEFEIKDGTISAIDSMTFRVQAVCNSCAKELFVDLGVIDVFERGS